MVPKNPSFAKRLQSATRSSTSFMLVATMPWRRIVFQSLPLPAPGARAQKNVRFFIQLILIFTMCCRESGLTWQPNDRCRENNRGFEYVHCHGLTHIADLSQGIPNCRPHHRSFLLCAGFHHPPIHNNHLQQTRSIQRAVPIPPPVHCGFSLPVHLNLRQTRSQTSKLNLSSVTFGPFQVSLGRR
jgi:hypothetical protein